MLCLVISSISGAAEQFQYWGGANIGTRVARVVASREARCAMQLGSKVLSSLAKWNIIFSPVK